jgi:hypothetical protein
LPQRRARHRQRHARITSPSTRRHHPHRRRAGSALLLAGWQDDDYASVEHVTLTIASVTRVTSSHR